jgi:prepilin-type N-terminal cleavage/methylation domain-containing protein
MQQAFTLVELLLVIAVVALITALALPALGGARRMGVQAREFTAARQLITAWNAYANDFRGEVMPGLASRAMVGTGPRTLRVLDEAGRPILGVDAQRYPWRIAPYMDFQLRGLYFDQRVFERYRNASDYRYRVALSPSMGINAEFVGGKADPGLAFAPASLRTWGRFYLQQVAEATRPDRLIVFASARGPDFDGGTVPGYFVVDAPNREARQWSAGPFTPESAPGEFGFVDPRHFDKAVAAMVDGHADAYSIRELDDMTRWANDAGEAGWMLTRAAARR